MTTPSSPPPAPEENAQPASRTRLPSYTFQFCLFLATVVSLLIAGNSAVLFGEEPFTPANLWKGWTFAVPLIAILLAHEFGHFLAARIHGVPASLPYFIPMPISPIGTMGAVILMHVRIRSRKALLDIGASGPIAGMIVALPMLVVGLLLSEVREVTEPGVLEGQCLLYSLIKRVTVGSIPDGSDVFLHPTAFAGWVGLLITMINLVPVGQLDGGHVAYALLGERQHTIAKYVHYGLLGVFAVNFGYHFWDAIRNGSHDSFGSAASKAIEMSMFWLVWFGFLWLLRFLSRSNHPPTEPGTLGPVRTAIAIGALVLFVLLFMPTPLSTY